MYGQCSTTGLHAPTHRRTLLLVGPGRHRVPHDEGRDTLLGVGDTMGQGQCIDRVMECVLHEPLRVGVWTIASLKPSNRTFGFSRTATKATTCMLAYAPMAAIQAKTIRQLRFGMHSAVDAEHRTSKRHVHPINSVHTSRVGIMLSFNLDGMVRQRYRDGGPILVRILNRGVHVLCDVWYVDVTRESCPVCVGLCSC